MSNLEFIHELKKKLFKNNKITIINNIIILNENKNLPPSLIKLKITLIDNLSSFFFSLINNLPSFILLFYNFIFFYYFY